MVRYPEDLMMEETQLSFRHLEISRLEAMVEIMFLAAYADGSINDAERAELARHVAAMSDGRVGADVVESLISIIERSVRDEGRSGRFAALRVRLPDVRMREAAIELAVRLVAADGVIHESEHALLVEAARALEVPIAFKGRVVPGSAR
ncbi:tellurite resistance TerB family protein [Sorangium sp. So ce204]|uniref:tellurite resistance TerB family protein n=2 Tax=unclassified Sorangium TaxID=2621164 RepID=UPI003F640E4D